MNNNIVVTVITPTFNIIKEGRKNSLIRNIESVMWQDYQNIEHLVIDGASTDGTLEILKEYSAKGVLRYTSEPDLGLYDAMNKGIKNAIGDYILILNSDDCFISRTAISDSIKVITEKNADFSYAKARCVDTYGVETPMPNCYAPDISHIFNEMTISHQTILCSKEMFDNNFFSLELEIGGDYEWIMRACLNGARPCFLDEYIVEFHRGGKSDRIKYYHKYLNERITTYYKIFKEYDVNVTEYDCKLLWFEQYVGDRIWKIICERVKFPVLRGYFKKSEKAEQLIENTWYVTAKNALLLRLFQNYAGLLARGKTLAEILKNRGYYSCAIYGYGNIGQCVYTDLIQHGYDLSYIVDKNVDQIIDKESLQCKIYSLEDEFPKTDLMIITPVFYYEEILMDIEKKIDCPIISLDDFVQM